MDISKLKSFLFESTSHSYANADVAIKNERDGSHSIEYSKGNLRLHDNYFGGEPFGGREVIFENEKPLWMMVYYGSVEEGIEDFKNVYAFLRKALSHNTSDMPYRGPVKFEENEWLYTNELTGDMENFSGEEKIFHGGELVYSAKYHGGLVDVRKE